MNSKRIDSETLLVTISKHCQPHHILMVAAKTVSKPHEMPDSIHYTNIASNTVISCTAIKYQFMNLIAYNCCWIRFPFALASSQCTKMKYVYEYARKRNRKKEQLLIVHRCTNRCTSKKIIVNCALFLSSFSFTYCIFAPPNQFLHSFFFRFFFSDQEFAETRKYFQNTDWLTDWYWSA